MVSKTSAKEFQEVDIVEGRSINCLLNSIFSMIICSRLICSLCLIEIFQQAISPSIVIKTLFEVCLSNCLLYLETQNAEQCLSKGRSGAHVCTNITRRKQSISLLSSSKHLWFIVFYDVNLKYCCLEPFLSCAYGSFL